MEDRLQPAYIYAISPYASSLTPSCPRDILDCHHHHLLPAPETNPCLLPSPLRHDPSSFNRICRLIPPRHFSFPRVSLAGLPIPSGRCSQFRSRFHGLCLCSHPRAYLFEFSGDGIPIRDRSETPLNKKQRASPYRPVDLLVFAACVVAFLPYHQRPHCSSGCL